MAAFSAANFSAYDDTWPLRVTTPSLTETPIWAASTLGSHFSSSMTRCCSSLSVMMAVLMCNLPVAAGSFFPKRRAGWLGPTDRVGRPPDLSGNGDARSPQGRKWSWDRSRKAEVSKDLLEAAGTPQILACPPEPRGNLDRMSLRSGGSDVLSHSASSTTRTPGH